LRGLDRRIDQAYASGDKTLSRHLTWTTSFRFKVFVVALVSAGFGFLQSQAWAQ
jgi:hypothetical protein